MSPGRFPLRAWFRRYLIALVAASVLMFSGVIYANEYFASRVDEIKRVKDLTTVDAGSSEPQNYLLIGSDSRSFVESADDEQHFGSAKETGGKRSDTIMVIHIDPKSKKGFLVSFPRDLLVDIPGMGKQRINAAFNAGPERMIETLTSNFGIEVNHYLEVDFQSFQGIVDAMGGVKIYIPAPARDKETGLDIGGYGAGCYPLNGAQALAYVRSREYQEYDGSKWILEPTSDLGRIKRQQGFIRRLASTGVHQATNSLTKAFKIADKLIPKLTADESLNPDDVKALIRSFIDIDPNDPNSLEMITFPWKDGPRYKGQAVLYPDAANTEVVLSRLRKPVPAAEIPKDVFPSAVGVRVLNGTITTGLAAKTSQELQALGFNPAGVSDATKAGVTEVQYAPGAESKAKLVAAYLGGVGKLVPLTTLSDADVQLVLRSDFAGIVDPHAASASTTAAPETTAAPATTEATKAASAGKGGSATTAAPPKPASENC